MGSHDRALVLRLLCRKKRVRPRTGVLHLTVVGPTNRTQGMHSVHECCVDTLDVENLSLMFFFWF